MLRYVTFSICVGFASFSFADNGNTHRELEHMQGPGGCDQTALNQDNQPGISNDPIVYSAMYYAVAGIPFLTGVFANVYLLKRFPATERPYLNSFISAAMFPINTALSLPLIAPLSSSFQHLAFWLLHPFRPQDKEKESHQADRFESLWHATQATVSVNAQMSRNLLNNLTGRMGTHAHRARAAMQSNEVPYALSQLAHAAFDMRTLFAEVKPDHPFVVATIHTQFTDHVNLPQDFAERMIEVVQKLDAEFTKAKQVEQYYIALARAWLSRKN